MCLILFQERSPNEAYEKKRSLSIREGICINCIYTNVDLIGFDSLCKDARWTNTFPVSHTQHPHATLIFFFSFFLFHSSFLFISFSFLVLLFLFSFFPSFLSSSSFSHHLTFLLQPLAKLQ